LVGRALNALHGHWEHFWAPGSFSGVTLGTPEDIVAKAAYTLANPTAARLVSRSRDWPGLRSSPGQVGGAIRVHRPDHFFSRTGYLPEIIDLELKVPPGFSSAAEFRKDLENALAALETRAVAGDPKFLGAPSVLAQRSSDRPSGGELRRQLNPRVAARDKWKRAELLGKLKAFLADYRDALAAWREKQPCPVFPVGTYLMRVAHGVTCAAGP
jgi:hypothetical protein